MKKVLWIIIFASVAIFAQSESKLSVQLKNVLMSKQSNDKVLVWIFMKDKGSSTNYFLSNPELVVSQKSLNRRSKVLSKSSLISFHDIPVNTDYINELLTNGFEIKNKSRWLNGVSGYIESSKLNQLSELSFIKSIDIVRGFKNDEIKNENTNPIFTDNQLTKNPDQPNSFNYGNSFTQLQQINVPALHDLGYFGQGVTICLMDAGFNRLTHEAFSTMNIIAAWDFVNGDSNVGDEGDMGSGSHGTETLSTIGGFKEGKLIGPAFDADFILAKTENTDSETPVEEDNWIAALEWADSIGVDVTSTSLGYLDYDPPFQSYTWEDMDGNTALITIAGDIAVSLGIVVVNSAGNYGFNSSHNTLGAPADGDSIITAGAVESNGQRSSFSSVGPTVDGRIKPDVMAMGDGVVVASPSNDHQYTTASGTSFSCPLTAGVAALILSVNSNLTPMMVREAMWNTSSNHNTPNNSMGWGILNALDASNYFPIPVELESFSANVIGTDVLLNWITSTEKNNSGFEVQRKTKEENEFKTLIFVEGNGTTTEQNSYSFIDKNSASGFITYRLKQIDFDGSFEYSNTIEVEVSSPKVFSLEQNYPNPFNPTTKIKYVIPNIETLQAASLQVTLKIYDVLGNEIITLVNEQQQPGTYEVEFNAGQTVNLSSAVYFYQLKAGNFVETKKMILNK
jgi:subtilisin family serine protease